MNQPKPVTPPLESRLDNCFAQCKKAGRSALVTYIMAYDPNYEESLNHLLSLPEAGADIIELGIPFSDPMACLLYTSPSPRDKTVSRMPSSA